MTAFHAPVEDILFSLRHVAGAGRLPDWDDELAAEILGHFASFAEGRIAPLDPTGDEQGCRLENGRVRMPDGFADVYRELADGGWQGLTAPEEHGGMGLGPAVLAGMSEIFTGANHSLQMVTSLVYGATALLMRFGTEDQQKRFIPPLASGEWLSTMCLTEPGAGSDLSAIRTKAVRDGDVWTIEGEKIFISGGDQDMTGNILHLVLARTGAMEDGIRGLSLFACPAEIDGVRNGVVVTRIEEKMGLHASPTCQLAFDSAKAELVGQEGGGLKAMFAMMNHARLDVGLQGVAHAARAADLARNYAAERTQGRGAGGAMVTIDQHPDVARMIDTCDRLAMGGRALCHIVLVSHELGDDHDFVDFMTPVVKYACTEAGTKAADLAIQVMGGYGYLREYGAEQNWRDARICAIYEGTNGIHARTLASRGLTLNDGAGANAFIAFLEEAGVVSEPWQAEATRIQSSATRDADAYDFMELTCELAMQAAWLKIAEVAEHARQPERLQHLASIYRATKAMALA